mmetsp:Transcript_40822/g.47479  ORF Transcript_40822/g.47479 Transcript_40822/m.47479 type:complete len:253 (-) Transcript_40822:163-921(-)|eukprot:CAMPEP_0176448930 /NCGR_PEP_ID=MMETSP0127-20121128/26130_1 /TAXON_ID=938130 /ORGANISM="Platyophrya macrostoma, Strain WH" /LENGTH=252 /DNA_ID=CAMNT_0017836081 /DNA_START=35 /DNA_END=793 /DNA_ORIENTATION=-
MCPSHPEICSLDREILDTINGSELLPDEANFPVVRPGYYDEFTHPGVILLGFDRLRITRQIDNTDLDDQTDWIRVPYHNYIFHDLIYALDRENEDIEDFEDEEYEDYGPTDLVDTPGFSDSRHEPENFLRDNLFNFLRVVRSRNDRQGLRSEFPANHFDLSRNLSPSIEEDEIQEMREDVCQFFEDPCYFFEATQFQDPSSESSGSEKLYELPCLNPKFLAQGSSYSQLAKKRPRINQLGDLKSSPATFMIG